MKCVYCGKEIQDLDTFCPRCGKRLVYRDNNTNNSYEETYLGNSYGHFRNASESTYVGFPDNRSFEKVRSRREDATTDGTYLGNHDRDMYHDVSETTDAPTTDGTYLGDFDKNLYHDVRGDKGDPSTGNTYREKHGDDNTVMESSLNRNSSHHAEPQIPFDGSRSFNDKMFVDEKRGYKDPTNEKYPRDARINNITDKKTFHRKWVPLLIILVILIAAGGTGIAYTLQHQDIPEKTITLSTIDGVDSSEVIDDDGVLTIGELDEKTLTFTVEPEDKTDTVKYTSSDESIITIENTGKYTAQLKGIESESDQDRNATITVTVYDKKKEKVSDETIDVRVFSEKQYVSSIQDVDSTSSVYVGDFLEIHPSVEPEDAYNKDLVFLSSDESVATIEAFKDESGDWYCKVKGVESGESTIRVRSNDRSNEADDVFVEMIVTVKPKPEKKESSKKEKSSDSTTDSESNSDSSSSEGSSSSSGNSSGSSSGSSYSGSSSGSSGGSSSYRGSSSGSSGSSSGSSGNSSGSSGSSSGSSGSSSGSSGSSSSSSGNSSGSSGSSSSSSGSSSGSSGSSSGNSGSSSGHNNTAPMDGVVND